MCLTACSERTPWSRVCPILPLGAFAQGGEAGKDATAHTYETTTPYSCYRPWGRDQQPPVPHPTCFDFYGWDPQTLAVKRVYQTATRPLPSCNLPAGSSRQLLHYSIRIAVASNYIKTTGCCFRWQVWCYTSVIVNPCSILAQDSVSCNPCAHTSQRYIYYTKEPAACIWNWAELIEPTTRTYYHQPQQTDRT